MERLLDALDRFAQRARGTGSPSRVRRAGLVLAGGLVLIVGAALVPLPGPGLPVVAAGLALLAGECGWARALMSRVRRCFVTRRDGPARSDGS